MLHQDKYIYLMHNYKTSLRVTFHVHVHGKKIILIMTLDIQKLQVETFYIKLSRSDQDS